MRAGPFSRTGHEGSGSESALEPGPGPGPGPGIGIGLALALAFALAIAVAALGLGVAASPAAAGDNVAIFEIEPAAEEVAPGETVEVDVFLRSHGAYGDTGVASVDLWFDYPTSHVSVVDVDPGDWFLEAPDGDPHGEGREDPSVSETVRTSESGVVSVDQSLRDPNEGGVIGYARFATLTLEVSADADPADVVVEVSRSDITLTSRYPQPVAEEYETLAVAGGGERVEPAFVEEPSFENAETETGTETGTETESDPESTDGEATADGTPTETTAGEEEADATGTDDAAPGFGVVAAILALLAGTFAITLPGQRD